MSTARERFDDGTRWTDDTARQALPILLALGKARRIWTYGDLDREIRRQHNLPFKKFVIRYRFVLAKIGSLINQLSDEWQHELPPVTILIKNDASGEPGEGVDDFLKRYVTEEREGQLTDNNRAAMVKRATDAVHRYEGWDGVAEYFGLTIPTIKVIDRAEAQPIVLPPALPSRGGESEAHLQLKRYVASHPELFAKFGVFGPGTIEFPLDSGDEIDVHFSNSEQTLAVEVKTNDAPPGELTRGIFQCIKYQAVLNAMDHVAGELRNVQVILVTPQKLLENHKSAAKRLGVKWMQVKL